jgi:hypothetical protein
MSTTSVSENTPTLNLHAQYVRKEAAIAVVINSLFSALFVFLVFGRRAEVALWGADGVALDFVPQTFIITMITVMVATLLTRKRVRSGVIQRRSGAPARLPQNSFLRALLLALVATIVFGGVMTGLLALLWSGPHSFIAVLIFKIAYGAIVAAVMAALSLRAALNDA